MILRYWLVLNFKRKRKDLDQPSSTDLFVETVFNHHTRTVFDSEPLTRHSSEIILVAQPFDGSHLL